MVPDNRETDSKISEAGSEEKEKRVTEFPEGHVLFRQGSRGGDLFFILDGTLELTVRDEETGRETVVARPGPRSILGTMTFLEGEARSATGKCVTAVKAIVVTTIQREKLLKQVPEWFKALLKDLSGNLRRQNDEYARLAAKHEILERRFQILKSKVKEDQGDEDPKKAGKDKKDAKKPDAKAETKPESKPE